MIPNDQIAKNVARYVRDLLDYDEQLIRFDRENTQQNDLVTNYIVVNTSSLQTVINHGESYDGDSEIMTYSSSEKRSIVLEFYGQGAYSNAESFSILNQSQKAREASRDLGLTIKNVSSVTDVKQLLGFQYGNRVHVEFIIQYCPSADVSVLRVDTVESTITVDK